MPRNGTTGVATQPINTRAVDGETIMADKWNSVTDDIYSIVSAPTPITQGGTGATTASAARNALDVYAKSETYTKGEVDGFRTTDQNAAKDAGNLNAGTVPDDRLPLRLAPYSDVNITFAANLAIKTGGYICSPGTVNTPSPDWWYLRVESSSDGDVGQRFTRHSDGAAWTRRYVSGAWTTFKRIYQTAEEIQSIVTDSVKAWVTFTAATGSVVISGSKNVSSVTRNGTGDYTVNFTSSLADANYAAIVTTEYADGEGASIRQLSKSASAYRFGPKMYNVGMYSREPGPTSIIFVR